MHNTIAHYGYNTGLPGPKLLVLGAIHGDEPCGPQAMKQVMDKLNNGLLELQKGSVCFVPVCNPAAFEAGQRQVQVNLNRVFKKHSDPALYEERLANTLTALVDGASHVLDLHSYQAQGQPFVFQDYQDKHSAAWIEDLGLEHALTGWPDLYPAEGGAGDTAQYAHETGKILLTVECGQHDNPQTLEIAYQATINTMNHLGLISGRKIPGAKPASLVQAAKLVFKPENPGWAFAKNWAHLDALNKGDVIAACPGEKPLTAFEDGHILLPKKNAKPGQEWFILGR